jgi:hypothetical protein
MSRKKVLGLLSVVLFMFPLASCTSVGPSTATTPTAAASRNTISPLSTCGYALVDVAEDWQVAFMDYAEATSTGTELPALQALLEVADRSDISTKGCTSGYVSENSELEFCADFANILESANQSLSRMFMKQLVAWDEGRYNAAVAIRSEIYTEQSVILGLISAGC